MGYHINLLLAIEHRLTLRVSVSCLVKRGILFGLTPCKFQGLTKKRGNGVPFTCWFQGFTEVYVECRAGNLSVAMLAIPLPHWGGERTRAVWGCRLMWGPLAERKSSKDAPNFG